MPRVVVDPGSRQRCPACAALEAAPSVWRELSEPARHRASVESVVDHLGFCSFHACALAAGDWPEGLAAVIADALGALDAMLGERVRYEERLLHIMFRARRSCAACALERRRAAALVMAPATPPAQLCLPHYRLGAERYDLEQLAHFAGSAQRTAESLSRALERGAWTNAAVLDAALNWLAGDAPTGAEAGPELAGECCVCAAARASLGKWLDALASAGRLGIGLETVVPLCAQHLRQCAAASSAQVAHAAAHAAARTVAAALARGLAENDRAQRRERDAAASVFYRRRAASQVLRERRATLRLPRCRACERVRLACERAQGEVLDRLASGRTRRRDAALCMRHFAGVYLYAPHAARGVLAAQQRAAISRARKALGRVDAGVDRVRAALRLGGAEP